MGEKTKGRSIREIAPTLEPVGRMSRLRGEVASRLTRSDREHRSAFIRPSRRVLSAGLARDAHVAGGLIAYRSFRPATDQRRTQHHKRRKYE